MEKQGEGQHVEECPNATGGSNKRGGKVEVGTGGEGSERTNSASRKLSPDLLLTEHVHTFLVHRIARSTNSLGSGGRWGVGAAELCAHVSDTARGI
jgi:hypothetical protein